MKRTTMILVIVPIVFIVLTVAYAQTKGARAKRPLPQDFGNVVMNNFSEKNDISPVVFKHWLHRAKYTCMVCHVDIGFGMKANETEIRCDDIKKGFYCGSCHNGKEAFALIAKKPSGEEVKNCERCHSYGRNVKFEYDFFKFTEKFPRERFGNGINWEKAEDLGLIKLKKELPGITIKKKPLENQKDFNIESKVAGIPDIIFSHKKHTVWSGCELCHPDIFGVKKGKTRYSMEDLFKGKYCGACHGLVAFPNNDCQRCHTTPVLD